MGARVRDNLTIVTVCSIFITMVKVRPFYWWCLLYCSFNFMYLLFHEMIKVFFFNFYAD